MRCSLAFCIAVGCVFAAGCGLLPSGIGWTGSSELEYYFAGGEPTHFAGPNGQDSGAQDLSRHVLADREYYIGLGRHVSGPYETEYYKMRSGEAFSMVVDPTWLMRPTYYHSTDANRGSLTITGSTAFLVVPVGTDMQSASGLRLSCHMDAKTAQEMINQVRFPEWQNNVSTQTMAVTWTLTGSMEGKPLEISFDQTLVARSYWFSIA